MFLSRYKYLSEMLCDIAIVFRQPLDRHAGEINKGFKGFCARKSFNRFPGHMRAEWIKKDHASPFSPVYAFIRHKLAEIFVAVLIVNCDVARCAILLL